MFTYPSTNYILPKTQSQILPAAEASRGRHRGDLFPEGKSIINIPMSRQFRRDAEMNNALLMLMMLLRTTRLKGEGNAGEGNVEVALDGMLVIVLVSRLNVVR